jgi:DNA-binding GntR family transcriptional regulator
VALRNEILHLALKPGAKLDEMGLVRKFGISRTPVREALIRLASEGLVFLLPNRGAQVAPLDLVDIAHYFEALELLQCAVNHWRRGVEPMKIWRISAASATPSGGRLADTARAT